MKHKVKIILVNLLVFVFLLLGTEVILRLTGKKSLNEMELKSRIKNICSQIRKNKLKVYNAFYTDGDGIYRANPQFDFSSIDRFRGISINSQGFRGNKFVYETIPPKKILLVGDSFTWGATARPITNSFANLLQNAGYHVYNGGIAGTDPIQYLLIVKKYTPILKPDIVAVCLFLGNDVKKYPNPVMPNKNLHYLTNAGMIKGFDDRGRYFQDKNKAIEYTKKRVCGICDNIWESFLYKTVVGKAVYEIVNRKNYLKIDINRSWVTESLKKIQQICEKNESQFFLFIIPVVKRKERRGNSMERNLSLFQGMPYHIPKNLTEADYCSPPNNHFNNKGHKKFADYMLRTIKKSETPLNNKKDMS